MKISSYTKQQIKSSSRGEKPSIIYRRVIVKSQQVLRKILTDITMIRLKNQYYEAHENFNK